MTRFLSRVFADLGQGSFNGQTDRLFTYHHATKHTYQSVRANARFLDWHNQPNPFRTYEGAPLITLPTDLDFPDAGTFETMAELGRAAMGAEGIESGHHERAHEPVHFDLTWLSRLLWHSAAVSAWKKVPPPGSRYSLRVNPSSGNLHPTEIYLAVHGFTGQQT